jgi:F0F1-type ATP synthase assembly protein I
MARGKPNSQPINPWRLAHMGLECAGAAVVMGLAGWWIDSKLGSAPIGVITGGLLGFAGGMYLLIKEGMEANRRAVDAMKRSAKKDRDDS